MNMVETEIQEAPAFDLTANWLCLDFANTLDNRLGEQPRELLNSYTDLVAWSQQAGQIMDAMATRLLEQAALRPREAVATLQQAKDVREAIYRLFLAIGEEAAPAEEDLQALNTALGGAMAHARIVPRSDGYSWGWEGDELVFDRPLWSVVRSAADLLTTPELQAVRVCAAEDCGWLFLDTSKNGTRRWCSMKSCGNRAKARRHYKKEKVKE